MSRQRGGWRKLIGGGKNRAALIVAALTTCSPLGASAAEPLQVKLGTCEPVYPEPLGLIGPGYSGPGYGNDPSARKLLVTLAYHVKSASDDISAAIAATTRIQICRLRPDGVDECPPSWEVHGPGKTIDPSKVFVSLAVARPNVDFELDSVDFADPNVANTFYYVRINENENTPANIVSYGACHGWTVLVSGLLDPRFVIYGVNPAAPPPGMPAFDVCTEGAQVNWLGAPGPPGPKNVCLSPTIATYLKGVFALAEDAQQARIQAALDLPVRVFAWRNGTVAPGTFGPHRIFLGPHRGAGGQSVLGGLRMNVDDLHGITPGSPPETALQSPAPGGPLAFLTHEYFHSLQGAWGRQWPVGDPHINNFTSEALATSVENNQCLENFPNTTAECVSSGKLAT